MAKDVVKDRKKRHLSWILWVELQCNHICPRKRGIWSFEVDTWRRMQGEARAKRGAAIRQGMTTATKN